MQKVEEIFLTDTSFVIRMVTHMNDPHFGPLMTKTACVYPYKVHEDKMKVWFIKQTALHR